MRPGRKFIVCGDCGLDEHCGARCPEFRRRLNGEQLMGLILDKAEGTCCLKTTRTILANCVVTLRPRYFVSEYTDGPATRWNVIDRQTQEWVRRFSTEAEAQQHADKLNAA